jgi:hypothetical protein
MNSQLLANSHSADPFQSTKFQILRQKYEYMTHYLAETENRLAELRNNNARLRERAVELEREGSPQRERNEAEGRREAEGRVRAWREEERDRTKKIEELKRLIAEYRYLCQEATKMPAPVPRGPGLQESGRENSFFSQLESSENENLHNVSVGRNKSYQKVKTRLYCQRCESEFRPNEYYRHL